MSKFNLDVGGARYSDLLEELLGELGAKRILHKVYEADYQGHVDVGVLLEDGRVFSYNYSYGSCSGCDDWEARHLSDDEVKEEMRRDATYFSGEDTFKEWQSRRDIPA